MRRHRWWPLAAVLAGALIVGVCVIWVSRNHSTPASFGQMSAFPSTAVTRSPDSPVHAVAAASPATVEVGSIGIAAPATPAAAQAPTAAGAPVRVMIPALGVDAPVDEVMTGAGQVLRPPDDPSRVGWWIASSPPGAGGGPTVLVGHVDSAAGGPGALFRLTDLEPGNQVLVRTIDNTDVDFSVTGRWVYTKSDGLPPDLFALDGPARLVVITCGGTFDPVTASYEENIVLVAEPSSE